MFSFSRTFEQRAENGSLSGLLIHKDVRGLAGTIVYYDEMRVHAGALEFPSLELARRVISYSSNVTRPQAPGGAGHHSRGHLPAGQNARRSELHFRIQRREMRQLDDRVGGIHADTHDIHARDFRSHCIAL